MPVSLVTMPNTYCTPLKKKQSLAKIYLFNLDLISTPQNVKEELEQATTEKENLLEMKGELLEVIGEPDKPEIERNVEDIDSVIKILNDTWIARQMSLNDSLKRVTNFQEELMVCFIPSSLFPL